MSRLWTVELGAPDYPDCLLELGSRAPEVIYGLGERDLVTGLDPADAVTIIGARRSGTYGREMAKRLGSDAGAAGLVVVSGMALGCDAAAHEGALDAGGRTLAVLGGPADDPYPRSNTALHGRIIAEGNAVISEQPPGTEIKPGLFPVRNRILAALAGLTVVVEGSHKSGTSHTVKEALDLGREVAAVPGPVTSVLSEMPNQLLKDGCPLIRDAQDLLDAAIGVGEVQVRGVGPALEPTLFTALRAVEGGASTSDAVALDASLGGGAVAVALARLELMGYVRGDAMGRYERTLLRAPSQASLDA